MDAFEAVSRFHPCAVVRSSSGTAGLIHSALADGVAVEVAVAVDCETGDDTVEVGVTTARGAQELSRRIMIRISFFTKTNYSRRNLNKDKNSFWLNII